VASILILVQKELEVTRRVFIKRTGLLIRTFYIVAVINRLGLLPYVFTATRHLCVTLRIATTMFIRGLLFQWSYLTKESLSHIVPSNCPTALIMFIVLVETLSLVIRPLTLRVRLMANIVAGHLIMALTAGGISSFVRLLTVRRAIVILTVLELAVALIQAYVVVVLLSLYLREV
jgi:ATP synthase subunit 6